jgi:hypothetical protein
MLRIFNCLTLLFFTLLFGSCQRVIDVQLNSSRKKYVIEGVITDQSGGCRVSITQTKDFSSDNSFAGVSGATVTIENNGIVDSLAESAPGVYTSNMIGEPGWTYTLRVFLDGVSYTAASTMPLPVGLDSIYVSNDQFTSKRFITVAYTDPRGIPNFYRWVQYVNGKQEPTVFGANDEFTDGLKMNVTLNFTNDTNDPTRDINTGESVRIDMLGLDSAVYQYWFSLQRNASGSGNSATPTNPASNISGGCLGYFSAQTVSTRSLLVPEK